MDTKAKINLKDGLIELEGSEEFVSKHLEQFRHLVQAYKKEQASADKVKAEAEEETADDKPNKRGSKKEVKGSKPVKAKTIETEKFDYTKDGSTISLQEFWDQKKPGKGTGDIIAVVGYYIQKIRKKTEFTEGNVDFAYRVLNLKGRPKHLHQIFINNKNQKDLFEEIKGKESTWKLTRGGEIYVEEQLPRKTK